ncbi:MULTISPECIES: XRE family transcriptional regulator [Rhizobium]|uniref:Transcriptional regulator with XRE-family HTH domain n=1 Tax=Rhizobium metallidurans TaxID=1265931 RepID=A0A7W6CL10_9HYPH|nr:MULTISPECIES: XRE family transcriptional regulator [Rhizobium]MBB3962968.1 transcriptional regulator with XRE-family HTH domain [Rhizobium metallidurans]
MENINTPQLGPLLQRQRKSRNLTLAQLSAVSGVSKSMLSQIERGQANPTFAVVWNLTRALKIDFADLLEGGTAPVEPSPIEIQSTAHTPEIRSDDGRCRLRILSPARMAGSTEWYEVEIQPGGILDSAPHAPGAFEHFTALTSGFEIASGGTTKDMKSGETARYPADVPHHIANKSAKIARGMLMLVYR